MVFVSRLGGRLLFSWFLLCVLVVPSAVAGSTVVAEVGGIPVTSMISKVKGKTEISLNLADIHRWLQLNSRTLHSF